MRRIVFALCVLFVMPTSAFALSQEFLSRVIERCVDGVAERTFANMSQDSRFLKLTQQGTLIALDDESGSVEVHLRLDSAVFRSQCNFALRGGGAVSDTMAEFFTGVVARRGFERIEPVTGSNFVFLLCDQGVTEATYRRLVQREEAFFNFVSRPAEKHECERG